MWLHSLTNCYCFPAFFVFVFVSFLFIVHFGNLVLSVINDMTSPSGFICIFLVLNEFKDYFMSLMTIWEGMDVGHGSGKRVHGEVQLSLINMVSLFAAVLLGGIWGKRSPNLFHLPPIFTSVKPTPKVKAFLIHPMSLKDLVVWDDQQ